jgi:hypothetical protein
MHALHAAVLCALELDHAAASLFLVTGMERHACFFFNNRHLHLGMGLACLRPVH